MHHRRQAKSTFGAKKFSERRSTRRTLGFESFEKRLLLAADWLQQDQVFAFDEDTPEALASFGVGVEIDGDTMVVGSWMEDLGDGLEDAGARVYLWAQ